MKRMIAGLLTLMMLLTGCGAAAENSETGETPGKVVTIDVVQLYSQLETVGMPEMLELDESMRLNLYGIRAEDVKQVKVAVASDGLRADEIWLVEAVSEEAAQTIKGLADSRIRQKDLESITYSPEQNAIVKKAVVAAEGSFVYMICSPDVEKMVVAIDAYVGK